MSGGSQGFLFNTSVSLHKGSFVNGHKSLETLQNKEIFWGPAHQLNYLYLDKVHTENVEITSRLLWDE